MDPEPPGVRHPAPSAHRRKPARAVPAAKAVFPCGPGRHRGQAERRGDECLDRWAQARSPGYRHARRGMGRMPEHHSAGQRDRRRARGRVGGRRDRSAARHYRLPVSLGLPLRMAHAPEPQALRDVSNLLQLPPHSRSCRMTTRVEDGLRMTSKPHEVKTASTPTIDSLEIFAPWAKGKPSMAVASQTDASSEGSRPLKDGTRRARTNRDLGPAAHHPTASPSR